MLGDRKPLRVDVGVAIVFAAWAVVACVLIGLFVALNTHTVCEYKDDTGLYVCSLQF